MVKYDLTGPQTAPNAARLLRWVRIGLATVAGNVTFLLTMQLLFDNPLTRRLLFTDAAGQSSKVLTVWVGEPQPAITPAGDGAFDARALAVLALLLLWSFVLVLVFARVRPVLAHGRVRRGVAFGVGIWAVVFVFFEVWMPFNALGEPIYLTGYELLLELVAMIAAGVVISGIVGGERHCGS